MRASVRGRRVASIVISLLILFVLLEGAINFMRLVDWDFGLLTDTGWFPRRSASTCARSSSAASIMGSVAMLVAVPFGLGTAIYLSEYAPRGARRIVKPIIEMLAGIPSVVVGFFVLNWALAPKLVKPVLRQPPAQEHARRRPRHRHPRHPDHGVGLRGRAALGPDSLREASYGSAPAGQHGVQVVVPAAVSGIVAARIIATSRAIGETMVATMAAGGDGSGTDNGPTRSTPACR